MDLAFVLTAIGALGVLFAAGKGSLAGLREARRRWSNRLAAKDYYCPNVKITWRFLNAYGDMVYSREVDVVALRDGVQEFRFGVQPASKREVTIEGHGPETVDLVEVEPYPPDEDWKDFVIRLRRPLKKGESLSYWAQLRIRVLEDPPKRITSKSNHRIDHFRIRVLFPDGTDPHPKLRVYTPLGDIIEDGTLPLERGSLECGLDIAGFPIDKVHSIEWDPALFINKRRRPRPGGGG